MSSRVETLQTLTTGIVAAAATEKDVLGAAGVGVDVGSTDALALVITNTGANAIQTVTVYGSPLGTTFVPYATNYGPIAAAGVKLIELTGLAVRRLRVTVTSSAGTTCTVEARGSRAD